VRPTYVRRIAEKCRQLVGGGGGGMEDGSGEARRPLFLVGLIHNYRIFILMKGGGIADCSPLDHILTYEI